MSRALFHDANNSLWSGNLEFIALQKGCRTQWSVPAPPRLWKVAETPSGAPSPPKAGRKVVWSYTDLYAPLWHQVTLVEHDDTFANPRRGIGRRLGRLGGKPCLLGPPPLQCA